MKALWVKDHSSNFPPKIHNLLALADKGSLKFSEEQSNFLDRLNQFQLEGRYPDYQGKIHKIATAALVNEMMTEAKKIKQCILKALD